MNVQQALAVVIDMATRHGENLEEQFSRRITVNDTDLTLMEMVGDDQDEFESATEIRDLWRAIKILKP